MLPHFRQWARKDGYWGAPWQRSIDIRFDQISNKMNSSPISLHQWQWKEMKRHYRGSPTSHLVEEFRFEMPSKTSSDQECSSFSAWLRTMWYHVESQKPLEMATKTMQVSRSNSPKSQNWEKKTHSTSIDCLNPHLKIPVVVMHAEVELWGSKKWYVKNKLQK